MDGYIKIYRSLFSDDSWIWMDKPFSRGQAWIDLLQMANIKDSKVLIKGNVIEVKRGQLLRSVKSLSDRWGWNTKKTDKFLTILKNEKMVVLKGGVYGTLITIENYAKYNALGGKSGGVDGGDMGEIWGSYGGSNKKNKKNKKNKYIGGEVLTWIEDIVPDELVNEFIEWANMRNKIKKPITTQETIKRRYARLIRLSNNPAVQMKIIRQSIDNCWADFYELKTKEPQQPRYKEFVKEEKNEGIQMPEEIREKLKEIF